MNKIIETPKYHAINENPDVILEGDLLYENDDLVVRVYAGFITDGGSLPRFSWTLLGITPYDPRCVYAFFIHDFIYGSKLIKRPFADIILDEVLSIPPHCSETQRWLIYKHVRMYGWMPWMRKTRKSVLKCRKFGEIRLKTNKYQLLDQYGRPIK